MKRCAIYTRKSSEEGLDQHFNSLDAQREACEAYVLSQAGEGWNALPDRYDDGGYSGGTIERPALQRLLVDIGRGCVDVVVVYKIDRLTRSLPDFARIVEQFDAREVSFVSVTQAFNTTSSMGRLTLNVLLSFAQFEREVTGERIRDKISASKAKGMWMGGLPPLGYDAPASSDRILEVNEAEAAIVRSIFERYFELGSVHGLVEDLAKRGIKSKHRVSAAGTVSGGQRISRGATFHLLRNRVYIGQIVHKGEAYPGLHERIVSQDLFDRVQAMLAKHRHERSAKRQKTAPLAGKLFLADGRRLTPTHSRGSNGTNYRYYMPVDSGPQTLAGTAAVRLPALRFEAHLRSILKRAVPDDRDPLGILSRIEIHAHRLVLSLPLSMLSSVRAAACHEDEVERTGQEVHWMVPWTWPRRGCSQMGTGPSTSRRDPVLIKALRAAHAMLDHDRKGRPFLSKVPSGCYQRRLAPLAFLSPFLQAAIVDGRQPAGLTLEHLMRNPLPFSWDEQEQFLGKLAAR